jgi:hypothetical protein
MPTPSKSGTPLRGYSLITGEPFFLFTKEIDHTEIPRIFQEARCRRSEELKEIAKKILQRCHRCFSAELQLQMGGPSFTLRSWFWLAAISSLLSAVGLVGALFSRN